MRRYIEDENGNLIPDITQKYLCSPINHKYDNVPDGAPGWGCRDRSLKEQKFAKHCRWIYLLKNDSIPPGNSPEGPHNYSAHAWERRLCNRKLRHFSKIVDFILPSGRWLVRGDVTKGMPKEERSEIDRVNLFEPIKIEYHQNWWEERE